MINGFTYNPTNLAQALGPKLTKLMNAYGCSYVLVTIPNLHVGKSEASVTTNIPPDEAAALLRDMAKGLAARKSNIIDLPH